MHVEMRLMSSVYNDNNKSFDLVGNNNESVFFEHMDQIDRMYHVFSTLHCCLSTKLWMVYGAVQLKRQATNSNIRHRISFLNVNLFSTSFIRSFTIIYFFLCPLFHLRSHLDIAIQRKTSGNFFHCEKKY